MLLQRWHLFINATAGVSMIIAAFKGLFGSDGECLFYEAEKSYSPENL